MPPLIRLGAPSRWHLLPQGEKGARLAVATPRSGCALTGRTAASRLALREGTPHGATPGRACGMRGRCHARRCVWPLIERERDAWTVPFSIAKWWRDPRAPPALFRFASSIFSASGTRYRVTGDIRRSGSTGPREPESAKRGTPAAPPRCSGVDIRSLHREATAVKDKGGLAVLDKSRGSYAASNWDPDFRPACGQVQ